MLYVIIVSVVLVFALGVLIRKLERSGGKKLDFGKARAREMSAAAVEDSSVTDGAPTEVQPSRDEFPADPDVVISKVTKPSELPPLPTCDHPKPAEYVIDFLGKELRWSPEETPPVCPTCLGEWLREHCTVCAACGDPIMPGDEVATAWSGAPQPYTHLYMDCCDCGAMYCGRWGGDGLIPLHVLHPEQFPPGTKTVMSHTFNSGQVVIVSGGRVETAGLTPEQKAALTIPEGALDQIAEENKKNRD